VSEGPVTNGDSLALSVDRDGIIGETDSSSVDSLPLYVDLDGTLLKTDSLHEGLAAVLKEQPWVLFLLFFWLLRGRAYLKQRVAHLAASDVACWPYDQTVLNYVRAQHRQGRPTILATGADAAVARTVIEHLGCFSDLLASDGVKNLIGSSKLELILEQCPDGQFEYIGNSQHDRPIWQRAKLRAVAGVPRSRTVGADGRMQRYGVEHQRVFFRDTSRFSSLLRAMRPHQWAKNLIVFIPVILAHRYGNLPTVIDGAFAFLSLSIVASATYLFNDLLDLQADRLHSRKCRRPLAQGDISLVLAGIAGLVLLTVGGTLAALMLPSSFLLALTIYCVISLTYSAFFKRAAIVDVVILAGLYVVRIFAGAAATTTPVSQWLLVFALFFFLSLALIKRATELLRMPSTRQPNDIGNSAGPADGGTHSNHVDAVRSNGRGYVAQDTPVIIGFGVATGVASPVVLGFYLTTHAATQIYDAPTWLLLAIPMLLYWIARMWLVTCRGNMDSDPVAFALRDKQSYFVGLLLIATVLVARHSSFVTWIVN